MKNNDQIWIVSNKDITFSLIGSLDCDEWTFCDQMTLKSLLFITFPLIGNGTELLLSKKFFDQMHSLDCDKMNKVEQSWTKLNRVEQQFETFSKVWQTDCWEYQDFAKCLWVCEWNLLLLNCLRS